VLFIFLHFFITEIGQHILDSSISTFIKISLAFHKVFHVSCAHKDEAVVIFVLIVQERA